MQSALTLLVTLLVHVASNQLVHRFARRHYRDENILLFDLGHKATPDLSVYRGWKDLFLPIFLLPLIGASGRSCAAAGRCFATSFALVVLLRSVTSLVTILPKHPTCVSPKDSLSLKNRVLGHCYDLIFSGHMSFGLVATTCLFGAGIIPRTWQDTLIWALINAAHAFILIATRSHYTVDVVLSVIISLFIAGVK